MTIARLGPYDQHCLRVETADRPIHMGILAIVDGAPLRDARGLVAIAAIRQELERRTRQLPGLRRLVHRPGLLAGGPIWVDDPAFAIEDHVSLTTGTAQPGAPDAMTRAEALLAEPLARTRPLWRLWLLDGLDEGRIGVLFVVHHALADGLTAMRLARLLLEGPQAPDDPAAMAWHPAPRPSGIALAGDTARRAVESAAWLVRPATWRRAVELGRAMGGAASQARQSPASSLNGPVGARRATSTLRFDLLAAKRLARSLGCGVNDLVLGVITAGVRALLMSRGEDVLSVRPRAGVAVALFSGGPTAPSGNDIGSLLVPLPLAEEDSRARLAAIARERTRSKAGSLVAAEPLIRARLARLPGYRAMLERQRLINLAETYLPGPPRPINVLGARVRELIPFAPLAGNIGLSFVALSYAGQLGLTVRADADQFPDLAVLTGAIERDWRDLAGATRGKASRVGAPEVRRWRAPAPA